MPDSTIITEQFVRINQTPASIGERIFSDIIDLIVIYVYLYVSLHLLLQVEDSLGTKINFFLYTDLLLALGYPFLCETFNRGQSLGKYLLNIRVVKTDGSTPSMGAYLMRWLFLLVDSLCLVGALIILFTKNNQRIGDLAAGTMVIKEKNYRKIHVSLDEFDYLTKDYHPIYPQSSDLSLEQVNVITRTLSLTGVKKEKQIKRLSQKVQSALSVVSKDTTDEKFLQNIVRDYQYYALEEI